MKQKVKTKDKDIIIKNSIKEILKQNSLSIISLIVKGIKFFILTFLKPFWFSSSNCKKGVVVPYIYTTFNMLFFYISIFLFLKLSWMAATVGIKTPQIILPAISSVVGILVALNHSMISLYNRGKTDKPNNTTETKTEPPSGVMR